MSILKLKVTSYHRLTPGQVVEQTFTEQGGSIGRSAKSDWVLPDPDKVISSVHAYISFQSAQFYITDNSTNGLFVNRSVQPLGKGNSQSLADGDYLQLGDYEVEVAVEAGIPEVAQTQVQQTAPPITPSEPPQEYIDQTALDAERAQPTRTEAVSQDPYAENFTPPMAQIPEDWDHNSANGSPEQIKQATEVRHPEAKPAESSRIAQPASTKDAAITPQTGAMTGERSEAFSAPAKAQTHQQPQQPAPAMPASGGSFDSIDGEQAKAYLTSFLNAAGLREDDLPREVSPALFEAMGGALRFSLQGMLDILRARSDMKSEFRVMQTTIRTQENNPLKFSINVDEAMRNLFLRQVPGFLPWFQAIESCFKDMSTHELALMAGTQGALQGVLDTLNPEEISRANQSESALQKVLPATKKAKMWDVFVTLHKETQEEVGQGSEKTFSEDFAAAYEAQLKKLGAN